MKICFYFGLFNQNYSQGKVCPGLQAMAQVKNGLLTERIEMCLRVFAHLCQSGNVNMSKTITFQDSFSKIADLGARNALQSDFHVRLRFE